MKKILIALCVLALWGCEKQEDFTPPSNCGKIIPEPNGSQSGASRGAYPNQEWLIYVQYPSGVKEWLSIPKEKFIQLMVPGQTIVNYPVGYVMQIGATFCR